MYYKTHRAKLVYFKVSQAINMPPRTNFTNGHEQYRYKLLVNSEKPNIMSMKILLSYLEVE